MWWAGAIVGGLIVGTAMLCALIVIDSHARRY